MIETLIETLIEVAAWFAVWIGVSYFVMSKFMGTSGSTGGEDEDE